MNEWKEDDLQKKNELLSKLEKKRKEKAQQQ